MKKELSKRLLLMLILTLTGFCEVFSQNAIKGVVCDKGNEAIIGASVMVKGTTNGTITDLNGEFTLNNVSKKDVLIVSFMGYKTTEIPVGDQTVLNVTLLDDTKVLDEVVVVGYGTQKKGLLTAAVSSVKSEEIQSTTHISLAQRLEGKIAGLQIRQNSGEPGSFNSTINVRGFGTPLFIVDGTSRISGAEFQRINPEDIEDVSVLKDGAAAIYGMDAANGVVLVTTKRGSQGKTKFQYNGSFSLNSPTEMPDVMNAIQYIEMRNDASVNMGLAPLYSQETVENWRQGLPGYESVDWYKETMKGTALSQQHTLSARGGNEKVNYFMSFGYMDDDGLLRTGDLSYKQYTFRSNFTAQLTKRLKAEFNVNGLYQNNHSLSIGLHEIIRGTIAELPIHTPYINNDKKYPAYVYDGQAYNPIIMSNADIAGYNKSKSKSLKASVSLTYDIPYIDGLQLKGVAYYEHGNAYGKLLQKRFTWYTYDEASDSYNPMQYYDNFLQTSWSDADGVTLQLYLLYKKTFAKKHNVSFTGTYEERKGWSRSGAASRYFDFLSNDQMDFGDTENMLNSGMENETGFMAFLGRATYDYLGKYMFEFAARYDGSYRYHPDNRWGFFPSVQVGWRISEEKFFKRMAPFISNLKLRGSYGVVGENAGTPFQYIGGFTMNAKGYEFTNGSWTSGAKAPALTNNNLTWLKSKIADFGVDLGLLNGRLNMTFDIYQRNRDGLLATRLVTLPNTFGATMPQENLNKDRVRGLDLAIGYGTQLTRDLSINVSANFNFARRMIVYAEHGAYGNSMERWRSCQDGRWQDVAWMYDYMGQFQSKEEIIYAPIQDGNLGNTRELPGDFRYRDVNGDGVIDGNDVLPLAWSGDPKMHYGFTIDTKWKGFDLNVLLQGSAKYSVRFTHYYAQMFFVDGNMPEFFYDRWHLADPFDPSSSWIPGKWPAARRTADVGAMYSESSVWRRDASYLRIKSVELGYTIPLKLLLPLGIHSLRIYVSGYNLYTFCDKFVKPFDPEKIEGYESAGWVYPLNKSFNFGVNLIF